MTYFTPIRLKKSLGGSDFHWMLERKKDQLDHLRVLIQGLQEDMPHPRDYLHDAEKFKQDQAQHKHRIYVLDLLRQCIEQEATNLSDQIS